MIPHAILIQHPLIDFSKLLSACSQIFDRDISDAVDSSVRSRTMSDTERFLSLINAMKNPGASVDLPDHLLGFAHFGILIAAEDMDMLTIMEICSGAKIYVMETKEWGLRAAIITASLHDWQQYIILGCGDKVSTQIRECFNNVYMLFVKYGVGSIWKNLNRKATDNGKTFLLLDK